jgi:transcriptional regulator with XRE-family HTH domain
MAELRQRGRPRNPRPPGLAGQLGQQIEQSRKRLGMSAEELSDRAGVGLGTVIRAEAGGHFLTLDTALAIAHALGMSGAELLAECPAWSDRPERKWKRHAPPKV